MNKKSQFQIDNFYFVKKPGSWLSVPQTVGGQLTHKSYPLPARTPLKLIGIGRGSRPTYMFNIPNKGVTGVLSPVGKEHEFLVEWTRAASVLQKKVIRLAYARPDLRPALLATIKQAAPPFRPFRGQKTIKFHGGELLVTSLKDDYGRYLLKGIISDNQGRQSEILAELVKDTNNLIQTPRGDLPSRSVEYLLDSNWKKILPQLLQLGYDPSQTTF